MLVAGGVILLVLGLFAVTPAAGGSQDHDAGCGDDSVDLLDPEPYEPDYGTDDPGVGVDRDAACPETDSVPPDAMTTEPVPDGNDLRGCRGRSKELANQRNSGAHFHAAGAYGVCVEVARGEDNR
jgi:hypothetical protein